VSSTQATCSAPLQDALGLINRKVVEGLNHGFFDLSVEIRTENQDRRSVTVRCGASHRFVVRKEDIPS